MKIFTFDLEKPVGYESRVCANITTLEYLRFKFKSLILAIQERPN